MKKFRSLVVLTFAVTAFSIVSGAARHNNNANFKLNHRAICGADTLIIYQDCKMCVCPRPNQPAKCFRKSCDLRTKDGGMCPPSFLKLDDYNVCQHGGVPPVNISDPSNLNNVHIVGSCKTDNDCPGRQFCCFDFCLGAKCVHPVPLDMDSHPGRGYP